MLEWFRKRRATQLLKQAVRSAEKQAYAKAIQETSAALLLMPDSVQAYQQRGMWQHLAGDDAAALRDYAKAVELAPSSGALYLQRGEIYAEAGRHQEAIADFEAAIRLDLGLSAYPLRAKSYLALDDLPHAITDLSEAIHLDTKGESSANYRLRAELYTLQNNFNAALSDYAIALPRMEKGVLSAKQIVGQLTETNTWAHEMVAQLTEQWVATLISRATLYQLRGDLPAALADVEKALGEMPESADAHNLRGRIRYQMDEADAVEDYQHALTLDPLRFATYLNLAEAYFKLNQYPQALKTFANLAEHAPDHVLAKMGMALAEHAMGERKKAYQIWRGLLKVNPKFGDLAWLKSDLFAHHPLLLREANNLVIRL